MKFLKNKIAVVALFTIGSMNAKQIGLQPTTVSKKTVQTTPTQTIYKPSPTSNVGTFDINKFKCISGSVLLKYTEDQQEYVILTRESRGNPQEQGGKLHTYDDFSGACEKEDNYEPLLSAAREFWEEGNLKKTLGWSLEDTIKFVKSNTEEIIVYTKDIDKNIPGSREVKNVTYIVKFDKYANKLFNNFYTVVEKEMAHYKKLGKSLRQVTLEKDKIAAVSLNDLREIISYQKIISAAEPVRISARIKDSKANTFHKESIVLRPFLSIKLRPYFLNLPYEKGENSKVRYYRQ